MQVFGAQQMFSAPAQAYPAQAQYAYAAPIVQVTQVTQAPAGALKHNMHHPLLVCSFSCVLGVQVLETCSLATIPSLMG